MRHLRKRLTYANVMSSIAERRHRQKIKRNAVTTAKIRNRAVPGAKINLATLGTVPSAAHASFADGAGNANTVGFGSVNKVFAKIPSSSTAFFAREAGAEPNSELISGENDRGQLNLSGAQSGGAVVSGVLGWDDTPTFDKEDVCAVYGQMTVSG